MRYGSLQNFPSDCYHFSGNEKPGQLRVVKREGVRDLRREKRHAILLEACVRGAD